MKIIKIMLSLALLGTLSMSIADDVTTDTTTETTVDAQIEAIQEAPAQERVRLMNQFKQRLMEMNEAERVAAIEKLQTTVQTERDSQTHDMLQTHTRVHEHVQDMQTQVTQEMQQHQEHMNQHQIMVQDHQMHTEVPTTNPLQTRE